MGLHQLHREEAAANHVVCAECENFSMPTYEYQCSKCNKTFEHVQSIADKALTICPKEACRMQKWGKGKVKRIIGAGAGLIFKGSGFYITDYRSEGYKAAAKKEAGDSKPAGETKSSGEAKTSGAGSDSKSAAKSPDKPAKGTKSAS